ncbi:MAG: CBS domain-containing protein [Nocardioidaceae bacterium]|nr:CBS domain-containing protein [Nocardioidaceae bacterium]
MRIQEIMQGKGGSIVTASPDTTVRELVALLTEHNIGAVVVSSGESQIAGIVSERDVVRRLAAGVDILDSAISEIMTSEVRSASPRDTVDDLMRLMTEHRIRHVPVVVDGSLQGIVSIGDVVKSRMGELEFERDQLSSYVSNTQ